MALNNDTTLSDHFFHGMMAATNLYAQDLVAPCYNDVVEAQSRHYSGDAAGFQRNDLEEAVALIDGTCFSMTAHLVNEVGYLDEGRFGRHGWGAIDDLILRVRALGGTCRVTQRAYLEHDTGATANTVMTSYSRYAYAEMRRGMRRKWGKSWRMHFPPIEGPPDSLRTRIGDQVRAVEERLGLTETWIGRR